jgi:hypothetical protein
VKDRKRVSEWKIERKSFEVGSRSTIRPNKVGHLGFRVLVSGLSG